MAASSISLHFPAGIAHENSSSSGCGSGTAPDSEDSQTGAGLMAFTGQDINSINSQRRRPPRQKINARERYRTLSVNAAYEALRGLIPTDPLNRKLSKIEIIRLASSYITHLTSTLHTGTDCQPCLMHKYEGEGLVKRISICTFCFTAK
ncbi:transcription factor 15 [Drosophila bipectinata]|uniref:transcription factor 15 n=1 Tax=Drosophila bipectinata TaxID=42026 RepID=UPI001C89EC6B|nr:transcription factor 15 [Drosophila bipectinata]